MQNNIPKGLPGIHPSIAEYWRQKYGAYLALYKTNDFIIYVENGTLDSFHPSGDKLARHQISINKTVYIWNNNTKEPLTKTEYLIKMQQGRCAQGED